MKTRENVTGFVENHMKRACRACCFASAMLLIFACAYRSSAQSTPIVVQTMAALRALDVSSFTNDTTALLIDYYAAGATGYGRGGGLFRWTAGVTYTEDGGRYIAPATNSTSGRWRRMLNGDVPNVKMWGAKGDGSTIDYTNIQNAINACSDNNWAGEILFPVGTYIVTNTLVFNSDLCHIKGDNVGSTIVQMPTNYHADIFRTYLADGVIKGTLSTCCNWDHHLLFENLQIRFQ